MASVIITKEDLMPFILSTCPSFQVIFDSHLSEMGNEERFTYLELWEFARHIFNLLKNNNTELFWKIFLWIEHLLTHGDKYVQEAIVVWLLEDLQNIILNENSNYDTIEKFLLPRSHEQWTNLIKFWWS